jgi:hypothetical protein
MTNKNLEFISGTEMQELIVTTMKELMWVSLGEVLMTQKQKEKLASDANKLVEKFQRDFIVN